MSTARRAAAARLGEWLGARLADPGDGPPVRRQRGRAAAVPRPAGAGARTRPRRASPRATRPRCANATGCWPTPPSPIRPGSMRSRRSWPRPARRWRGARARWSRGSTTALAATARAAVRPARARLCGADARPIPPRLRAALADGRRRDRAAGRTLTGPHRDDLAVTLAAKDRPAAECSTGEQKAMLIAIVLAHAALQRSRRARGCCCSTRSPRTSTRCAAPRCSSGCAPARRKYWLTGTELGAVRGIAGEAAVWRVSEGGGASGSGLQACRAQSRATFGTPRDRHRADDRLDSRRRSGGRGRPGSARARRSPAAGRTAPAPRRAASPAPG